MSSAFKRRNEAREHVFEVYLLAKVGVIGVGYWGKKHVEEFSALGAEVYVSDLDQRNVEICQQRYGAHPSRLSEMLANKDIKAVTICTPIPTHYQLGKQALQAGKHTLIEKPLAMTVRQAEYEVRLAREKRVLLATGHIYRFNNAVSAIKRLLQEDSLGDIYIAKFAWTNLEPVYRDRDIISDLAPHPFDIMEDLFGKSPDEVSCIGNSYRQRDLTEATFVNCRLGRILVNIELSWLTPWKQRTLHLVGSRASVSADLLTQEAKLYMETGAQANLLPIEKNNTIRDELKHFLDCIANGTRSLADGESAIRAIRMIEISRKALREKRTLRV